MEGKFFYSDVWIEIWCMWVIVIRKANTSEMKYLTAMVGMTRRERMKNYIICTRRSVKKGIACKIDRSVLS